MIRLNLPRPERRQHKPRTRAPLAAMHSRLTADWVMRPLSADAAIRSSLVALRARSRQLVQDYEYAARFVHVFTENVAGPHGLDTQPANVLRGSSESLPKKSRLDTELNARIKAAWEEWCEPETCTVDGRHSWTGVQQLLCRSFPADGEMLLRLVSGMEGNRFRFAVQVLDPDLLDETYDRAASPGVNAIRMGVEINSWGRPVAYWFWTRHQQDYRQDMPRERVRIPAKEVIHWFTSYRPGQTRGYPMFTPVLLKAQIANGYTEAELVAARMGAAAMGFLEQDPNVDPDDDEDVDGTQIQHVIEAEPGTFQELPFGKKLANWMPEHPTTAFQPFMLGILGGFAAGLNGSYATVTGDVSRTSFSSARIGSLQERDAWQLIQQDLAMHLHRRVYRAWLNSAVLAGAVSLGTKDASQVWACWFQPRGYPWVDPQADLEAAETEIRLGLKSRTTICTERGQDFREVLQELAEEQKLADELGVDISVAAPAAAPRPRGEEDGNSNGTGAEGDAGQDVERARLRLARS